MSVKLWVQSARVTGSPEGDLVADMRGDSGLPELFPNIGAMRRYLENKGACQEALAAVPGVWRRYRRWQRIATGTVDPAAYSERHRVGRSAT
jgi:hypothetical protein